jgi:hypothetical protein
MLAIIWFLLVAVMYAMILVLGGTNVVFAWPEFTPMIVGFLLGNLWLIWEM